MDAATERRIEEAVLDILWGADMEETTEYKVRTMAAEKLGLDLSLPDRKRFVRNVVESFLQSQKSDDDATEDQTAAAAAAATSAAPATEEKVQEEEEQAEDEEEEEEEEETKKKGRREKEYDDEGDLIVCRLSNKRRVTIQDFRGKTLVSIREYYEKDGRQMPSSKGISLTVEQWEAFTKAVPAIEDAIKKLED